MGNEVFGRALTTVREEITYGSGIADALRRHKVFPALLVRMVGVGERSGTLDTQFSFLAVHYLKKLDDISEKLGKIIEPMVIIFVGILFAVIILGLDDERLERLDGCYSKHLLAQSPEDNGLHDEGAFADAGGAGD
jgi:type II secretory pathway component PulF